MNNKEQLKQTFKKILNSYVLHRNIGIWGKMEGLINKVNIDNIVDELLKEVTIRTNL